MSKCYSIPKMENQEPLSVGGCRWLFQTGSTFAFPFVVFGLFVVIGQTSLKGEEKFFSTKTPKSDIFPQTPSQTYLLTVFCSLDIPESSPVNTCKGLFH